jgi:hypothetical protein
MSNTEEKPSSFVQLGNGAIFRSDKIAAILRKNINEYLIIVEGLPVTVNADGNDVDQLRSMLPGLKILDAKPKEEVKSRLEKVE